MPTAVVLHQIYDSALPPFRQESIRKQNVNSPLCGENRGVIPLNDVENNGFC